MVEARKWLETNKNEHAFAGNRFESTAAALDFVEMLYQKGACTVYVDNIQEDPYLIENEGAPYADTLIVMLPEDKAVRECIIEINQQEALDEFGDLSEYVGEFEGSEEIEQMSISSDKTDSLVFWWD